MCCACECMIVVYDCLQQNKTKMENHHLNLADYIHIYIYNTSFFKKYLKKVDYNVIMQIKLTLLINNNWGIPLEMLLF